MNYFKLMASTVTTALLGIMSLNANNGITIEHLGTNNSLVKVDEKSNYILFPVEESIEDAKINLLLDGKLEKTFRVRLARNKVDYYVPFDISQYHDKNILFNVISNHNRTSVRESSEDACWKAMKLSDTFDTTNREKFRPLYHHTPLYGWMNDPNGMFYKDGVWHLYYQWNPYGSKWENLSWGHSTSTDLINWEHHKIALEPDGLGYIFSGSSVIDTDNTAGFGKDEVISFYTSADVSQIQSMAHSADNGENFTVYPGNPIITLDSEARDPNMFWHAESGKWVLLLAHALDHEMLIFTSPDLKNWTLESSFGKGEGAQNGVWECPDLLYLPVNGTDEHKWVLICNLNPGGVFGGSATQYFVGDFDGKTFTADKDANGKIPTKWMDHGKDHYATVSWHNAPDNRNVVIGWMSNWQYAAEVPTKQFRSANTLPRDISLIKADDGQYYIHTIPSPEMIALRDKKTVSAKSKSFGAKPHSFQLPASNDGVCEILLTVNSEKADSVLMTLSNAKGEKVDLIFDPAASTVSFDRTQSGLTDFNQDFATRTFAPTLRKNRVLSLRIFIDRSSIEVFDGEGNFVITNLVFPTEPYTTLSLSADGGKAQLESLEIYSIK
ncbi:MAG: DUF4980 domain-containing protein [Muribaculaceae bacterium]|nr:DUF4980 domain-containing protein [Muribaculaceae bacterium]